MTTDYDQDIFGAETPGAGGGGKLDLPEPPFSYQRWATKDERTGVKTEHVGTVLEGVVVAFQRRQQWDGKAKKPRVQEQFLRDKTTPNPRAGEPKMETVHYVLCADGSIKSTSIYGEHYGNDEKPGPYRAAHEKAGLKQYAKPIGMGFAQKFEKMDEQKRIFKFKISAPDEADRERVIAAHLSVLEHLVLADAAYAGARWLRKPTTTAEEKGSPAALLAVIEAAAVATAKAVTPVDAVAKATVAKVLPLAMEAATSSSAADESGSIPGAESSDAGADGDDWD